MAAQCSSYDSLESLRLMEGLVDIYMPDFKFWDPATAKRLAKAEDYVVVAKETIKEMHRQVCLPACVCVCACARLPLCLCVCVG